MTDLAALERAVLARPGDLGRRAAYAIACAEVAAGSAKADDALRETRAALARSSGLPSLDAAVDAAYDALLGAEALAASKTALRRDHASALLARAARDPDGVEVRAAAVAVVAPLAAGPWPEPAEAAEVALAALNPGMALTWLDGRPETQHDADATALCGVALLRLEDAPGARARCEGVIASGIRSPDLLNVAGMAALMCRDADRARDHLMAARELAPARTDVLLNLVAAHAMAGHVGAALGVLDGLVDLHGPPSEPAGLRDALLAALAGT